MHRELAEQYLTPIDRAEAKRNGMRQQHVVINSMDAAFVTIAQIAILAATALLAREATPNFSVVQVPRRLKP